jgi:hypothetical protein
LLKNACFHQVSLTEVGIERQHFVDAPHRLIRLAQIVIRLRHIRGND